MHIVAEFYRWFLNYSPPFGDAVIHLVYRDLGEGRASTLRLIAPGALLA